MLVGPPTEFEPMTVSGGDLLDGVAHKVGESLPSAIVQEGQLTVVHAVELQDRGMDDGVTYVQIYRETRTEE